MEVRRIGGLEFRIGDLEVWRFGGFENWRIRGAGNEGSEDKQDCRLGGLDDEGVEG